MKQITTIEKVCLLATLLFCLGSFGYFRVYNLYATSWVLGENGTILPQMGEEGSYPFLLETQNNSEPQLEISVTLDDTPFDHTGEDTSPLNLNTASKEQLISLPNIGGQRADDIISYRESVGGFQSVDELMNVSGIGSGIFGQLEEFITVDTE